MIKTETVTQQTHGAVAVSIHVEGLKELLSGLDKSPRDQAIKKAYVDGIKQAGDPILASARSNAAAIADSAGSFGASLRMVRRNNGIALQSTLPRDEAATLEFAERGAKIKRNRSGSKLTEKRIKNHSGCGVPRGVPPRVMVAAVDSNVDKTTEAVGRCVNETLDRIIRGDV